MKHDDDIGAGGQGFAIAGLLVASVAVVAVVLENVEAETAGQVDGVVAAVVVHQDTDIHQVGNFFHRGLESLRRVVRGHDDCDAFAVNHLLTTISLPDPARLWGFWSFAVRHYGNCKLFHQRGPRRTIESPYFILS